MWGRGTMVGVYPVARDLAYIWTLAVPEEGMGTARMFQPGTRTGADFPYRAGRYFDTWDVPSMVDDITSHESEPNCYVNYPAEVKYAKWTRDNVAIAGPAAYSMAPFPALEASNYLEDIVTLGAHMVSPSFTSLSAAMAAYEADRKPLSLRLQKVAWNRHSDSQLSTNFRLVWRNIRHTFALSSVAENRAFSKLYANSKFGKLPQ